MADPALPASAVLEACLDAVIVADWQGRILEFNPAAEQTFGYARGQVIGEPLATTIVPPALRADHERGLAHYQASGEGRILGRRVAMTGMRADGSEFPIELAISAVTTQRRTLFTAYVRDISERRRAQTALQQSEERFRDLAERARAVPWEADARTWAFTYVGPQCMALLGYPAQRWYQSGFWAEHIHPDDRGWVLEHCATQSARTDDYEFDYRMRAANGDTVWVQDIVNVTRDASGPRLLRGYMLDISARKRAQAALKQSEARLRLITDSLPVLISYVDRDYRYQFTNKQYEVWFERSRDELRGAPVREILGDTAYGQVRAHIEAALAGHEVRYESWLDYDSGGGRHTSAVYVPDVREGGEVQGFCALVSDVTERKRAEDEIHRLNAELEQRVAARTAELEAANKELEAFSYSVSHDLRAPLRSIDGFSRAVLEDYRDKLDARGQDYLQRVRAASQHMAQLIDDLLDLSRVTRSELNRTRVNLSELAARIAHALHTEAPARRVQFAIAPGLVGNADERLMRIVLENLLGNAWKFTSGRGEARIELDCTTHGAGEAAYFVRDNGAGFDMAYADKLFGAFQRLHTRSQFEGTGVGLASVQRIIHRHGGRVWARAAPDQGATFYFTLTEAPPQ